MTCPKCVSPEVDTDNRSIVWRSVRRMKAATLAELTVKIDTNVATPSAPHPFRMPTTPGGQSPWAPMTPPCPTPATPPNPTPPNTPQSPQSVLEISGRLEPDPKVAETSAQKEYDEFMLDSQVDKTKKSTDIEHMNAKKQDEDEEPASTARLEPDPKVAVSSTDATTSMVESVDHCGRCMSKLSCGLCQLCHEAGYNQSRDHAVVSASCFSSRQVVTEFDTSVHG